MDHNENIEAEHKAMIRLRVQHIDLEREKCTDSMILVHGSYLLVSRRCKLSYDRGRESDFGKRITEGEVDEAFNHILNIRLVSRKLVPKPASLRG